MKKGKIFKLTGVLFSNEKGLEITTEEFEILDQNEKQIVLKDEVFSRVYKEKVSYGDQLEVVKFDTSIQAHSVCKGVVFYLESKWMKEDTEKMLRAEFRDKIQKEIEERNNWLTEINK